MAKPPHRAAPSNGAVAAGYSHTCDLDADGTLVCAGSNGSGESTPPAGTYADIGAGAAFSCACASGSLSCWGFNDLNRATPPAGQYASMEIVFAGGCALTATGAPACWGSNSNGLLNHLLAYLLK